MLFLVLGSLSAQETIRSTIGVNGASTTVNAEGKTYLVQQSVGQGSVIGQHQAQEISVLQGFIQPPITIKNVIQTDASLQAVVFPNPFDSNVTIRFSETIEGPISIILYDISGRIVYNKEEAPARELQVDFGFLSSASYLLHVSHAEKIFTANLIKN